jgi:hypothetical protein
MSHKEVVEQVVRQSKKRLSVTEIADRVGKVLKADWENLPRRTRNSRVYEHLRRLMAADKVGATRGKTATGHSAWLYLGKSNGAAKTKTKTKRRGPEAQKQLPAISVSIADMLVEPEKRGAVIRALWDEVRQDAITCTALAESRESADLRTVAERMLATADIANLLGGLQ